MDARHDVTGRGEVTGQRVGPARGERGLGRRAARGPAPVDMWVVLAVAAGGAVGGPARHAVDLLAPAGAWLPWSTLAVNVVGAFVLGWLVARLATGGPATAGPGTAGRPPQDGRRRYLRPFAAVGAVGSFTTFSTLALQVEQLLSAGSAGTAALYLGLSLAGGLLATWLGLVLGRGSRPSSAAVAS